MLDLLNFKLFKFKLTHFRNFRVEIRVDAVLHVVACRVVASAAGAETRLATCSTFRYDMLASRLRRRCFFCLAVCSAAVAALPRDVTVYVSPDYGEAHQPSSDMRGYVDVYINGKHNIGIELTRDGKKLQVHAERFGSQGRYHMACCAEAQLEVLDCGGLP